MLSRMDHSRAFDRGDSLWIIPHDSSSYWYQRLNWLTNFKLTANELHSRPKLDPWLLKLLDTCDIKAPEIPIADPLLVPVAQWLPADWLIILPYSSPNDSQFVQKIKEVWEQFQRPAMRVFVPKDISSKNLESLWIRHKITNQATFVFETE